MESVKLEFTFYKQLPGHMEGTPGYIANVGFDDMYTIVMADGEFRSSRTICRNSLIIGTAKTLEDAMYQCNKASVNR